jgi:single-strand DNA-binding protein
MAGSKKTKGTAVDDPDRNEVMLVGRLAAAPESRTLPSGDELAVWRLVVRRHPRAGPPGRPGVDTVDCATFSAALRRQAARMQAGDRVEVVGALRRRFWRTPSGPASRYEVEASKVRRLRSPQR